eukprot:TRINITY_DN607_c0_g1_i1.p1 TRINITY_DN607_c0_g1~~TRINITY_DN607_c0_g1_i1.p1  ORF type:complete len:180 (+),score=13.92 TRINITY_DN607_c0_g1_i1:116-655(+)
MVGSRKLLVLLGVLFGVLHASCCQSAVFHLRDVESVDGGLLVVDLNTRVMTVHVSFDSNAEVNAIELLAAESDEVLLQLAESIGQTLVGISPAVVGTGFAGNGVPAGTLLFTGVISADLTDKIVQGSTQLKVGSSIEPVVNRISPPCTSVTCPCCIKQDAEVNLHFSHMLPESLNACYQ